jgi:hypothetical protein
MSDKTYPAGLYSRPDFLTELTEVSSRSAPGRGIRFRTVFGKVEF